MPRKPSDDKPPRDPKDRPLKSDKRVSLVSYFAHARRVRFREEHGLVD